MRYMFCGCSPLKELYLSNFNTNNVVYMASMFSGCISLKELNLSNFNTNNVTHMCRMFFNCWSLLFPYVVGISPNMNIINLIVTNKYMKFKRIKSF